MELTKVEKLIVIGLIVAAIPEEQLGEILDNETLDRLEKEVEYVQENATIKTLKYAGMSAVQNFVKDFLESPHL